MKKQSKKIIIALVATLVMGVSALNTSMVFAGGLNGSVALPTVEKAFVNNEAQRTIEAGKEEKRVKPWVYANVKLNSVKSKEDKLNYGALALNRALGYFEEKGKHFGDDDFFIILNTGFIIDKDNYKDAKVFDEAKKAILDTNKYQGDVMFTIAFLSGNNTVINTNTWKLIDMVNLGPDSKYTYTSDFNVGITASDSLALSETIGQTSSMKLGGSIGASVKGIDLKLIPEINSEITTNLNMTFNSSQQVTAQKNESVSIQHGSSKPMTILRYQLVNNVNVNMDKFNSLTKDLEGYMNMGGKKIVEVEPVGGEKGIDVPTKIIYDVVIEK